MIKALIFDCFGVFYTDPVFARMRNPETPPSEATALHALDEEAAEGEITKQQFDKEAAQLLHESEEEAEHEFFRGTARNETLVNFVQDLRSHYRVALLSNIGADMMDGFFSQKDREGLFDAVVLSGVVGYAKPDPEIFKLTCEKLDVSPDEAIMIDDMESNIEAAQKLGMQGICYKDFEQFKVELDRILKS